MRICRRTDSNYLIVESIFVSVNTFWVFTSIILFCAALIRLFGVTMPFHVEKEPFYGSLGYG